MRRTAISQNSHWCHTLINIRPTVTTMCMYILVFTWMRHMRFHRISVCSTFDNSMNPHRWMSFVSEMKTAKSRVCSVATLLWLCRWLCCTQTQLTALNQSSAMKPGIREHTLYALYALYAQQTRRWARTANIIDVAIDMRMWLIPLNHPGAKVSSHLGYLLYSTQCVLVSADVSIIHTNVLCAVGVGLSADTLQLYLG